MLKLPILMLALLLIPVPYAQACLMDVPLVTEEDVVHVIPHPTLDGVISVKGIIKRITYEGKLDVKPHNGFTIQLKIIKNYHNETVGDVITVRYGACHNLPGAEGDLIYAIAYADKGGNLYAPQFWQRDDQ
ncbi:MAG: hypothetical protein MRY79_02380 [Alphaproteobacteria bacterium]|nr:hypothetical protein [Alphaproteobacteria bacterium]